MKALLVIIQLFLTICVYAQERINKAFPELSLSSSVISQLNDVTGWSINPEGEWVSRKNRIPKQIEKYFEKLIDSNKYRKGIDSFDSWEQRTVTIDKQEYGVLIKNYSVGAYRHPSSEEGYYDMKVLNYYIFDKKEFEKLKSLKANQPNLVVIDVLYSNGNSPLNPMETLEDVERFMVTSIVNGSRFKKSLILNIIPSPQKNTVQFLLFGISEEGPYKYYDFNEYRNSPYYVKKQVLFDEPEIFKEAYYETDFKTFQAFLPIEAQ